MHTSPSALPRFVFHIGVPGYGYDLLHAVNDPAAARTLWASSRVGSAQALRLMVDGRPVGVKTANEIKLSIPGDPFASEKSVTPTAAPSRDRRRMRP